MSITSFRGEFRWISNYHLIDIEYRGIVYRSTEAAYQAAKTFSEDERREIKLAATPDKARRLGQKVTLRAGWESIKLRVMRDLTIQKFKDPDLQAKLLATGLQHLVEENTHGDKFWGVDGGEGLNHLGRILMDVREEVRKETQARLLRREISESA